MYREQIELKVDNIFERLKKDAYELALDTNDTEDIFGRVADMILSGIEESSNNLMVDIYSALSNDVLSSLDFETTERKLKLYESNIDNDIFENCKFNVESLRTLKDSIEYKKIKRIPAAAAVSAGTAAMGGLLKYNFDDDIKIPTIAIIAGALLAFGGTYFKAVPYKNERALLDAIDRLLKEVKKLVLSWVDEVISYFNTRIEELLETF